MQLPRQFNISWGGSGKGSKRSVLIFRGIQLSSFQQEEEHLANLAMWQLITLLQSKFTAGDL